MSKKNEISVDAIASKLNEVLTNNRYEIDKAMVEETKKAMEDLVQKTKETAPLGKRTIHYKYNIASKVLRKRDLGYGVTYREIWYVDGPDYRLSHLLNNGHALRDGGRYEGTQFITKATDEVESAYIENLKKAIENGGR